MAVRRKAIQSLRLRLHSSLRQRGMHLRCGLFMALRPKAKALGYQPCPFEGWVVVPRKLRLVEGFGVGMSCADGEGFCVAGIFKMRDGLQR